MVFLFVFVLALIVSAPELAAADIVSCARAASQSTLTCRSNSMQAKAQADAVSANYNQQVKGKSVKETADLMEQATREISQIYQTAEQSCQSKVTECQQQCSDSDGSSIASACHQEMGKYIAQVGGGRGASDNGNRGAKNSSYNSSGQGQDGKGGVSADNDSDLRKKTAIPEDKGPDSKKVGYSDPASRARLFDHYYGEGGQSLPANAAMSPSSRTASGADLGSNALAAEATVKFCAEADNRGCPSCQGGRFPDQKNVAQLKSVCTKTCMADPGFGPRLADLCRARVRMEMQNPSGGGGAFAGYLAGANLESSADDFYDSSRSRGQDPDRRGLAAANESEASAPASSSVLSTEVAAEFSVNLFKVHSRVITAKCRHWLGRACAVSP